MDDGEARFAKFSRRSLAKSAVALAGASALGGPALAQSASSAGTGAAASSSSSAGWGVADVALVNGRFLTMDGRNSVASGLAIRDGRIVAVGGELPSAARTIDLKGASVIPGLIDAHAHIYWSFSNPGYEAREIELVRSIPELLAAISKRSATVPAGKFISCNGGWTRRQLKEKRLPTLAELDRAAPNHPVWIAEMQTEDAWIDPVKHPPLPAVVNTAGVAFFRGQGVAVDARTGQLSWADSNKAMMAVQTEDDRRRSIDDAIDYMAGHGLTMLHDFGNSRTRGGSIDDAYPYIVDKWRNEELKMRFRLRTGTAGAAGIAGLQARMANSLNRLGDDVLRLNGFGEGLAGGRAKETFIEAGKLVAKYGWAAHVHSVTVNNPGSIDQHLMHVEAYEAINREYPLKDLRWSMSHANYMNAELIGRLKAIGVGVQGDAWQYAEPKAAVPMGPPWRTLLDSGVNLGAGSDCTGTCSANPWLTIAYMVSGELISGEIGNPGQNLTRMEALKVHSLGSAWHSFDDDRLGSLEVGKLADLVVLSDDPLTASVNDLRKITSTLTLQGGQPVFQAA